MISYDYTAYDLEREDRAVRTVCLAVVALSPLTVLAAVVAALTGVL